MFKTLRRYLITGLIIWLPIVVTVLVLRFLINLMDRTLVVIPAEFRPEALLGFAVPGVGVVLTILVLLVTGVLGANLFGRKILSFWESILKRIPLIRSIY